MLEPTLSRYRPDIDGLRAIAILAVVAYHAGIPGFSGGYVGVDVFFVISGFLITRLLQDELTRTRILSFRDFYARRVRRLLPALALMIISVSLVWTLLLPGFGNFRKLESSVRWSLLGLANVFFKRNTGGYFDGASGEMPFHHLWSLAVEEQFYLFWPLMLSLLASPWIGGKFRLTLQQKTLGILALLLPLSFAGALGVMTRGRTPEAFYLMPYRAWELGVGAMLVSVVEAAARARDLKRAQRALPFALAVAGALLIAGAVAFYSPQTVFPGISALAPTIGAALLIAAGAYSEKNALTRILASRPLVHVGVLSYGWYLWHWPFLAMARAWCLGQEPELATKIALLAASLLVSELSLRWVETPARQNRFLREWGALRVVAGGAALSALLILTTSLVFKFENSILSARLGAQLVQGVRGLPLPGDDCSSKEDVGTDRCFFQYGEKGAKRVPTLAIWGDSHAHSYFPMIEEYARKNRINAIQYSQGDAPPLLVSPVSTDGIEKSPFYDNIGQAAIRDLYRRTHAADAGEVSVVLAARWIAYSGKKQITLSKQPIFLDAARTREGSLGELKKRLQLTLSELFRIGVARVIVLLPTPEFRTFTLQCLQKTPGECLTSRAELKSYRADVVAAIRETSMQYTQVRLIDPVAELCDEQNCPQVARGLPVVIDDNHPSITAVREVAEKYRADLDWLAGRPPLTEPSSL